MTRSHVAGDKYPEAELVTLGFQEEPLTVFQGRVPIRATVDVEGAAGLPVARLSLTVQACDDEKCLKPEDLVLELPLPDGREPS